MQRCEAELRLRPQLHIREDGTGWLEGEPPAHELPFIADFFISLGREAQCWPLPSCWTKCTTG